MSRFDAFSEEERSLLSLAITGGVIQIVLAEAGGLPDRKTARMILDLVGLMNEIGATFDHPGIDPELIRYMELIAEGVDPPR